MEIYVFFQVAVALPVLNQLIRSSDVEVMIDACWALSYISDGNDDNIQSVLDCGCANRMVLYFCLFEFSMNFLNFFFLLFIFIN